MKKFLLGAATVAALFATDPARAFPQHYEASRFAQDYNEYARARGYSALILMKTSRHTDGGIGRIYLLEENECVGVWANADDGVLLNELVVGVSGCRPDKIDEGVSQTVVLLKFVAYLCSATPDEIEKMQMIYMQMPTPSATISLGTCHMLMTVSAASGFRGSVY
jgi:hypothetical protein